MGNKLCIAYDMFTLKHPASIVIDNQLAGSVRVGIDDLETIEGICVTYDIDEIVLYGPKIVLEKFKTNFNTKYSNRTISIKIVE